MLTQVQNQKPGEHLEFNLSLYNRFKSIDLWLGIEKQKSLNTGLRNAIEVRFKVSFRRVSASPHHLGSFRLIWRNGIGCEEWTQSIRKNPDYDV